jgi:glutamate/tyrosine decarboxylase-like PLP-dependent enzyme
MTLRAYGTDRLGAVVEQCCGLATRLAARIDAEPALERLAPVPLNIVCFRVRNRDDAFNAALVADLHEEGSFAPSTTRIGGRLAIRAAIVNHRTRAEDVDGLIDAVLEKRRLS